MEKCNYTLTFEGGNVSLAADGGPLTPYQALRLGASLILFAEGQLTEPTEPPFNVEVPIN